MMQSQIKLSKLALLASLLAFVVIVMGAYTRLNNAGLSCPDWPRCYGYLTAPHTQSQITSAVKAFPSVPVDTGRAWIEMRHRYLAGLESLIILSIVIVAWCQRST